jgi:hypothetical protein
MLYLGDKVKLVTGSRVGEMATVVGRTSGSGSACYIIELFDRSVLTVTVADVKFIHHLGGAKCTN